MGIVKVLLVAVVALLSVFVVVGLLLPSSAHVERSAVVDAPPCTVFTLVNGFGRFNEWSPWAAIDPLASYSFEGPTQGVGARMSWTSDHPSVGTGSQKIVVSEPYELVETELDFGPQGTADAFFRLVPEDDGTRITWGFDTDFGFNLAGRWFGLFFDSMLGPDYDRGLAQLAAIADGLPDLDWCDLEVGVVELDPISIVATAGSSSRDHDESERAITEAFGRITRFMARTGLEEAGPPLAIVDEWGAQRWSFRAGVPYGGELDGTIPAGGDVFFDATPAGRTARAVHRGAYESLPDTYRGLETFLAAAGLEPGGPPWEQFVTDPRTTPEDELVTHVHWPIAGE